MMIKTSLLPAVLLALLSVSSLSQAQQVFITDSFKAPFRTGPTDGYRIQNYLRTGTPLKVLEHNSETGYTKVQTRKGTSGWVHKSHLTEQVIARLRIKQMEQKLKKAVQDKQQLVGSQSELQQNTQALQRDNSSLTEVNNKLTEELKYIKKISASSLEINQRNQELIATNQELQNETELLKAENDRLKYDSKQEFFMLGVGAVLLGMLASSLLPMLKPRKKDSGWV